MSAEDRANETSRAAGDDSILEVEANGQDSLAIPGDNFLQNAELVQIGSDLLLIGADGTQVLVRGFFLQGQTPMLVDEGGAQISPDLVLKQVVIGGDLNEFELASGDSTPEESSPVFEESEPSSSSVSEQIFSDGDGDQNTELARTLTTVDFQGYFDSLSFAPVQEKPNPIQKFIPPPIKPISKVTSNDLNLSGTADDDVLIGGVGNDQLSGLAGNDQLSGFAGNDILDGGTGADDLTGGIGDDTYVVDQAGDTVTELDEVGIDTVESSISYTLGDNVENLTLTGTADINATGTSETNILRGNSGANTLDGGAGADGLIGGTGNDIYVVDQIGDTVTELNGEGSDTVESSITYALGANVENLTLTGTADINATGTAQANVLIGNTGANIMDGGAGADSMNGGDGDDTYVIDNVGDVIVDWKTGAIGGNDTALSSVSYTITGMVENLTLTGTADIDAAGTAKDNILTGNSGANTLTGYGGNDRLDGGAGADYMNGGDGDDTYVIDNVGDVIVDWKTGAIGGNDTALSSVSYTIAGMVENLTLTGTADIDAAGTAEDNTLTGNSGANTLTGSGGSDMFRYTSDDNGDVITDFDAIDANEDIFLDGLLSGSFSFLGDETNVFSGTGNTQARFNDTSKYLEIDANGDGSVNIELTLTNVSLADLDSTDFAVT